MASEVIAYVAVSLDGYIAGDGGTVDFLEEFGSQEYDFHGFFSSVGAVVMGSTTYEQILGWGWPYGDKPGLVLTSRDIGVAEGADITFSSAPTGAAIRDYAATFDERLWVVGGGKVITDALQAGAIDTLEMYVMPVALGSGVPLFSSAYSGPLELAESRAFSNSVTKLVYSTP
ncbi:MAG: dihydrofolate reductase family protein [Actinomycetota bacterium]